MGKQDDGWKSRLVAFDFEVTAYDWLLCIKDRQTGIFYDFHNDPQGVEDFINEHDFIYVGYNNKHYDNYILKGVLNHYTPDYIKDINDYIIEEHQDGWTYPFDQPYIKIPPTSDLMLDMPLRQSLKELEGNMLMDIQESTVDFKIDHPWTKEEFDEMLFYCHHDVDATSCLIDERMDYLEAKVFNGTREGLTPEESLYRTNGQLASISLGAERCEFNDERDIQFPDTVNWDNIPKEVKDFFYQAFDENIPTEVLFNKKLKIDFLGLEWVFAWGGVHASVQNEIIVNKDGHVQKIADVTSLYPSLMEEYGLTSRAVPDPNKFFNMKKERIDAKHRGDKRVANSLKVPINTVYGISLQQFSDCYDPRNGRSVCVTGQLLLTDLCVELCKQCNTIRLTNVNTDGVAFIIHESEMDIANAVMDEWQKRTRLELEVEGIKRYIIKDVNNYILEKEDGSLKVKGAYVSDYKPSFKHNSFSIVAKAIIDYFINDVPVEDTINACNDPFQFQLIGKTGGSYDKTVHYVNGEEIEVQRVNRIYAVKNETLGVVKKVKKTYLSKELFQEVDFEEKWARYYINQKGKKTYKRVWETDEKGDFFMRKDTIQNCPPHALIDNSCKITIDTIDKEWYINLAKKRINDFLGIKENKKTKEKKKMAVAKTKLEPRPALYKKIFDLGLYLAKQPYITDGYNDAQGYEYIKSAYYRKVLGQGCREVGLIYKLSIVNRLFTPLEKTRNMNLITIQGNMSLIDPDTGEFEDYPIIAEGSDNLDKGIYKAETMAIKYFVLNNFLLPETQDEIDPESAKEDKKAEEKPLNVTKDEPKKSKPTPPPTKEEREEAKQEVANNDQPTMAYVDEMIDLIKKCQEKKPGYGEKTLTNLEKFKKGEMALTKTKAVSMMTKIEEKADELGVE